MRDGCENFQKRGIFMKKLLSAVLVLVMMFTLIPLGSVTASAETLSGTTENFSWKLDDQTLTISGSGTLFVSGVYPWDIADGFKFTDLIIEKGITEIGENAFSGNKELKHIQIPNSVISIDANAFNQCSGIKEINLPENLKNIGEQAFTGCTQIQKIVLPKSLEIIDDGAFENCKNLEDITIGENVTKIGSKAFLGTAFYSDAENWDNGILYIGKYLLRGTCKEKCIIKEGTTLIAKCAFNGMTAYEVKIPYSMEIICDYAFMRCHKVVALRIPDYVKSVGKDLFFMRNFANNNPKGLFVEYRNKSYYIKGSEWQEDFTGLTKYLGEWFYIKKGVWCKETTLVKYKGENFYVKEGKVDFDFSGNKKIGGKIYEIKNGKTVASNTNKSMSTVLKSNEARQSTVTEIEEKNKNSSDSSRSEVKETNKENSNTLLIEVFFITIILCGAVIVLFFIRKINLK